MEVKIPFTKMTAEELFVVPTCRQAEMAQISLQELVEECRKG